MSSAGLQHTHTILYVAALASYLLLLPSFRELVLPSQFLRHILFVGVAMVPTFYPAGVVPAIFLFFRPSVVANFPNGSRVGISLGSALDNRPVRRWSVGAANFVITASLQLDPLHAELATMN